MPREQREVSISVAELQELLATEFDQIVGLAKHNSFCSTCEDKAQAEMINYTTSLNHLNDVIFRGNCKVCGGKMVRYVEIGSDPKIAPKVRALKASKRPTRKAVLPKWTIRKPKTLHFKVSLNDSEPSIWRQFKVDSNYRFDRFHQVIQIAMGWHNAHLHEFYLHDYVIGMCLDLEVSSAEDETKLYLRDFPMEIGETFTYLYDFGDSWEHSIELVQIEDTPLVYPVCTNGQNACPLEDCGGIGGYKHLLKVLQNPNDEAYDEWRDWLPDEFDPFLFWFSDKSRDLIKSD